MGFFYFKQNGIIPYPGSVHTTFYSHDCLIQSVVYECMKNNKGRGEGPGLKRGGLIKFLPLKRWGEGGGRMFTVIRNSNKPGTHSKLPPLQLSVDSPTVMKWQICSGQF